MKCEQCGAAIRKGDGRFCSHCGAKLPDVPRITPGEWVVHPERFDEVEASAAFGSAMNAPAPAASAGAIVVPLVFLCFWLAIGIFIFVAGLQSGSPIFPLFSAALVTFGAVMILRSVAGSLRFARAPVRRRVAVVVDERVHVSGGGKNSSATTSYYATLQDRDGTRAEVATTADVAGMVTRGDIGVALLRLNTLVAFHRIEA